MASSFDTDFAPEAKRLLATVFPLVITEKNLAAASPAIQEIAARTGGVRASQILLAGNPVNRITPYGLWWPWEESQTISLRIGLEDASMADIEALCDTFNAVR